MNLRFWESKRDRVLRKMDNRLARIEKASLEGIEDDQLDEMLERMDRIERIMSPEEETAPPSSVAPQFAGVWERIPPKYRSLADTAVQFATGISLKEALTDASGQKMRTVLEKVQPFLPYLDKFLPKDLAQRFRESPNLPLTSGTGSAPVNDPYAQPPQ